MMIRIAFLAMCLVALAIGQHRFDNELVVTFRGEGALRVHTESNRPNSKLAGNWVVATDDGTVSHRKVMGPHGKILFAYDLKLNQFRLGEPVRRLVYTDAATGEQLFDVIERIVPVEQPRVSPELEISLEEMRILVNGKLVHASRNSWIINQSVRIDAPVPLRLVATPRQGGRRWL
jgi:hypothetical protein